MKLTKYFLVLIFCVGATLVSNEEHSLYSDKVKITVPTELNSIPVKEGSRYEYKFSDSEEQRAFVIYHAKGVLANENLNHALDQLEQNSKKQYPNAESAGREIIDSGNHDVGILTLKLTAGDQSAFLRFAIVSFENRPLMITFNPFPVEEQQWDGQMKEILKSIQIED